MSWLTHTVMQIKLYRGHLFDKNESLWKHILLGDTNVDPGYWSTGQSAAPLIRTLALRPCLADVPARKRMGRSRHRARARDDPALVIRGPDDI